MRFLLLAVLCCVFWTAEAQQSEYKKQIRKDVKELTRIYDLDKEQQQKAYIVQERYYLQLEEIASLKNNQYRAYLYKLKSVRMGQQFGLKKLLRSGQWSVFEAEQAREEQTYQQKLAALKAKGASKEELDLARITIE